MRTQVSAWPRKRQGSFSVALIPLALFCALLLVKFTASSLLLIGAGFASP